MADLDDDNADLIASDSTSLWPTEGDVHWFKSQKGRLWRSDGSTSLKNDRGRKPLYAKDFRADCATVEPDLCMKDPTGVRLDCPKTCGVYENDEAYYSMLETRKKYDAEVLGKRNMREFTNGDEL